MLERRKQLIGGLGRDRQQFVADETVKHRQRPCWIIDVLAEHFNVFTQFRFAGALRAKLIDHGKEAGPYSAHAFGQPIGP